jgi:hypothetical protein
VFLKLSLYLKSAEASQVVFAEKRGKIPNGGQTNALACPPDFSTKDACGECNED